MQDTLIPIPDPYLTECKMSVKNTSLIVAILITMVVWSCKKDDETVNYNPYHNPGLLPPVDTNKPIVLEPGSFQYLYDRVFGITCANSGCHDGNFPPDFRTIYSSYNTLVRHPVITNDAQNTYTYRVEPGNSEKSLFYARLTINIPNTSGLMPAVVDQGSDWYDKKDEYILMIKEWIDAGAPDTYGNLPGSSNLKPQVTGLMAFSSGSTTNPLPRLDNKPTNPIIIPKGPVDLWFAFSDDKTAPADFTYMELKSSYELFDFSTAESFAINASTPISGKDFWNQSTSFTHKATLNFPNDTSSTFIFLRTYLQDEAPEDTSIVPNDGTNDIMRSYFTLKVDSL